MIFSNWEARAKNTSILGSIRTSSLLYDAQTEFVNCPRTRRGQETCAEQSKFTKPNFGPYKIANPELWIALNHHTLWALSYPLPREAFFIHLADVMASAISRRLSGLVGSRLVFRIWKDEPPNFLEHRAQSKDIDIEFRGCLESFMILLTKGDIKGPKLLDPLIALLSHPFDDLDALYENLRPCFRTRAEAAQWVASWKSDGCPFASLDTHCDLTRRWFTFFNDESDYFNVPKKLAEKRQVNGFRREIMDNKRVSMLRVRVRLVGRLARLRDAVVLKEIPDVCQRLAEAFNRHTIYDLYDETLIVARAMPWEEVERRLQAALGPSTNFFLEAANVETLLRHDKRKKASKPSEFLDSLKELFSPLLHSVYPCLPTEIVPDLNNEASREAILCDLCQMAEARVVYPRDVYNEEDPVQEYLCLECGDLRKRASRLKQLVKWEESEEDVRVCFIKVSLDLRHWWGSTIRLLQQTFRDKLAERGDELPEVDLGFSILAEFLADYRQFLRWFRRAILALPDREYSSPKNHQEILPGLFALRIRDDSEARAIVKVYLRLFEVFFPKCRQEDTPIRLSVSCSNVKFPFLEHWDFLDAPQEPISLQSVRRARLEVDFAQWDALQEMGLEQRRTSAFLHRLAEIEARTGSLRLVEVELLDRRNEFPKVVNPFRAHLLKAQHILGYYKIARESATHE